MEFSLLWVYQHFVFLSHISRLKYSINSLHSILNQKNPLDCDWQSFPINSLQLQYFSFMTLHFLLLNILPVLLLCSSVNSVADLPHLFIRTYLDYVSKYLMIKQNYYSGFYLWLFMHFLSKPSTAIFFNRFFTYLRILAIFLASLSLINRNFVRVQKHEIYQSS